MYTHFYPLYKTGLTLIYLSDDLSYFAGIDCFSTIFTCRQRHLSHPHFRHNINYCYLKLIVCQNHLKLRYQQKCAMQNYQFVGVDEIQLIHHTNLEHFSVQNLSRYNSKHTHPCPPSLFSFFLHSSRCNTILHHHHLRHTLCNAHRCIPHNVKTQHLD